MRKIYFYNIVLFVVFLWGVVKLKYKKCINCKNISNKLVKTRKPNK